MCYIFFMSRRTEEDELVMRCTLNIKRLVTFLPLAYKYCVISEDMIYEDLAAALRHYGGNVNRGLIIPTQNRDKGKIPKIFL